MDYDICWNPPQKILNRSMYTSDRYSLAICMCPVPSDYAIIIDHLSHRPDKEGFYHFVCPNCGLHGVVGSRY